ncbi:MAG: hypothetical protein HGA28_07175 [Anaerolineaceae bacterium]|nr:hypothetical protein [Anaerolineaceae bacterium]
MRPLLVFVLTALFVAGCASPAEPPPPTLTPALAPEPTLTPEPALPPAPTRTSTQPVVTPTARVNTAVAAGRLETAPVIDGNVSEWKTRNEANHVVFGEDLIKSEGDLEARYAVAWDADYLCFSIREPFPSKTSSTELVFGQITRAQPLKILSELAENGVIFEEGQAGEGGGGELGRRAQGFALGNRLGARPISTHRIRLICLCRVSFEVEKTGGEEEAGDDASEAR